MQGLAGMAVLPCGLRRAKLARSAQVTSGNGAMNGAIFRIVWRISAICRATLEF